MRLAETLENFTFPAKAVVNQLRKDKVKVTMETGRVTINRMTIMVINPFVIATSDIYIFVDRACIAGIQD